MCQNCRALAAIMYDELCLDKQTNKHFIKKYSMIFYAIKLYVEYDAAIEISAILLWMNAISVVSRYWIYLPNKSTGKQRIFHVCS